MSQRRLFDFGFKGRNLGQQEGTDAQGSTESERNDPNEPGHQSEPKNVKKQRTKHFQRAWLDEFSWLKFESGKMFCEICRDHEKGRSVKSVYVTGTENFQHSSLLRHQKSDDHVLACLSRKQTRYMEAAIQTVQKKHLPLLEAQLRTALFMASQNIANRKFLDMVDLQISNAHLFSGGSGAAATSTSQSGRRAGIYTNNQAASTMQGYLADVLREMMIVRIRSSPYIGIMVDESLDIATTKKLVLFCKIINNGKIKIEFCANIEIRDGKAETIYSAINDWMASIGVNVDKVSGFGSDGAAVMMGKRSGVGIRMKNDNPRIVHVWCAAHRLALVSYWAAKNLPYMQRVQETLVNIYNFFEYSAPRYNKLRELKQVFGGHVKKFKKPTNVRWLSLQEAIVAVHSSWSVLVIGLEHEVGANPNSEGANKAAGILKIVRTFKFISTICMLKDVLEWICRLSKFFQKDIIDIDKVDSAICATKETLAVFDSVTETPSVEILLDQIEATDAYQGIELTCSLRDRQFLCNLKRSFIQNILREFDQRFSPEDMSILRDLITILNPKKLPENREAIVNHGSQALERVLNFYTDYFDRQEITNSFLQFKFLLNVNRHLSLQEMCIKIIDDEDDAFPSFKKMASLLMTIPLTSVPCERGFSSQNRHIAQYTSRRNVKNVENRMLITTLINQVLMQMRWLGRHVVKCLNNNTLSETTPGCDINRPLV